MWVIKGMRYDSERLAIVFSVDFCRPGDSYREVLLNQSKRIE